MSKRKSLNFRLCAEIVCLILLISPILLSQNLETKNTRQVRLWQQRTEDLTESVVKDSAALDDERALYFALLAKIWQKQNPGVAGGYARRAVDLTLKSIDSDDSHNLDEKLRQSEKTMQIVSEFDEPLSRTLAEKIAKIIESKGTSQKSSADSFVSIALQIVDTNPSSAFALGARSLVYGNSLRLTSLISRLNLKDSKLAEELFVMSLAAARRSYSYEFTGTLGSIVFEVREGRKFSDVLRRSYLETLADMISRGALIEQERATGCEVAPLVTPILDRFDEYLPARALALRQQLEICIPFSHGYTAEIAKAEARGDEPQSADDFIRAARDTNDQGLKGRYFFRAISKLRDLEKFDEIVSLLDDMNEVEVSAVGRVAWESWRIEYAYESALASFEKKDMPSVYRTINRTPRKSRPFVRFRLAYKLSPITERDFILENLEGIQKEVSSLEIESKVSASAYLSLARLYIRIQPTESLVAIREAVKYINKTDGENSEFLPEKDYAPLQDFVRLPYELLEADEAGINSSFEGISSRRSRIRLKLGLLDSSVQKLAELKKAVELENAKRKVGEAQ